MTMDVLFVSIWWAVGMSGAFAARYFCQGPIYCDRRLIVPRIKLTWLGVLACTLFGVVGPIMWVVALTWGFVMFIEGQWQSGRFDWLKRPVFREHQP